MDSLKGLEKVAQNRTTLVGHEPGAKCKCHVCGKHKTLEDKFMVRTGSFYNHGLNTRDEIRRKSRCNW